MDLPAARLCVHIGRVLVTPQQRVGMPGQPGRSREVKCQVSPQVWMGCQVSADARGVYILESAFKCKQPDLTPVPRTGSKRGNDGARAEQSSCGDMCFARWGHSCRTLGTLLGDDGTTASHDTCLSRSATLLLLKFTCCCVAVAHGRPHS
eukprot:366423-Chlamydomonas_euryale.AAC.6